jgi:hypothetical protein
VRDEALGKGIVINGLPIMVKEPSYSSMDIENLDWYYEHCVIGGPGSFVVTIKDRDKLSAAPALVRPSASTARKSWRRFASADGRGEMRPPDK